MPLVSSKSRWQRIEEIFHSALEFELAERTAFLDRACGEDLELRAELDSLLNSSEQSLGFAQEAVLQLAHEQADVVTIPAGKRIGAYQLMSPVGVGGMGTVFLASRADDLYQQNVAIKLMHSRFAQAQNMRLRFRAERQILANLNHPNVGRLLDGGISDDGLPYLVMELVDGVPIDEYCRDAKLSIESLLTLFLKVCAALEYAHQNLVIHRDIKPGNILVTAQGEPKLLDFGISKLLEDEASDPEIAPTSQWMMTPEYASPEQLSGGIITTATDVYALGILLYKLLCGESPFKTDRRYPLDLMRAIRDQVPEPPSSVCKAGSKLGTRAGYRRFSEDLDSIVLKAMRKEPAMRYASVAELADDLRRCLEGYPVRSRANDWTYHADRFVRRHKRSVGVAALSLVALIAFSIAMGVLAKRANDERAVAEQQRMAAQKEAEFLASIFRAATPDQAKGKQITARELLDAGAERIDVELATAPEVRATMLHDVGNSYALLGHYDQAQPLLERAYRLRIQTLGENTLDVAASAERLATVYRLKGEYAKAEPFFRQSLAIRKRILKSDDRLIAESLTDLGEDLYWEGRDKEAEDTLRTALVFDAEPDTDLGAATRNYLALALERRGQFDEAKHMLQESVDISKKLDGENSTEYAIYLQNLGGALIDSGNLQAAEAVELRSLAVRRAISGNEHPDVAYTLNLLGHILLAKGEWRKAEPFLWEALTVRQKELGEQHPLYASSLANWARVLQAQGNYAGAKEAFDRALEIMGHHGTADNWSTARILSYVGLLELDQGNYTSAEDYIRQALEMRRRLRGDESPEVASCLVQLGMTKELQGDLASAEPLFRKALSIRTNELPHGHPDLIATEIGLGRVLLAEGELALAEPILSDAEASVHNSSVSLLPWQIAEADSAMGILLVKQDKAGQAYPLLRNSMMAMRTYPQLAMKRRILQETAKAEQPFQRERKLMESNARMKPAPPPPNDGIPKVPGQAVLVTATPHNDQ